LNESSAAYLITAFLFLLPVKATSQDKSAASLLSIASYSEEVSGDLNKAVEIYLEIIRKYPEDRPVAAKSLYHLGLITEKMGKQKASDYFNQLIRNYPDQKELVALARAKLAKSDNQVSALTIQAENTFSKASDFYKQANFKQAAAEFEKILRLAPDSDIAAEALLWAGQCYYRTGENDPAMNAFNSLIRNYPQSTMVPVAELMISQVKLAMAKNPNRQTVISVDDNTVLDPATGITYKRINSLSGKNDFITSASSITDIAPNRKFLLADNWVVPFDNNSPYVLFKADPARRNFCRLSPDGNRIAYPAAHAILVVPVSPETGYINGPIKQYPTKEGINGGDLNWSPDGQSLVFSIQDSMNLTNFYTLSLRDGSIRRVTRSNRFVSQPVFINGGKNILYKQVTNFSNRYIKMSSVEVVRSLPILDSALYNNRFICSPDDRLILYDKLDGEKYLWRMADKQELKLSVPEIVGQYISWGSDANKVLFYCPSFENQDALRITSVYGGPGLVIEKEADVYPESWLLSGNSIIVRAKDENGNVILKRINLRNQESVSMENQPVGDIFLFSPDYSNILIFKRSNINQPNDLYIYPLSLNDFKITGEPTLILKGYRGWGSGFSWSPDGKKLAVCSDGDLWICQVNGGGAYKVAVTPAVEEIPAWSPDGNYISVFTAGNKLQILREKDGEMVYSLDSVDTWDWSPDGKKMVMATYDSLLTTISVADGKIGILGNWRKYFHGTYLEKILWSPDGQRIAINGPKDEVDFVGQIYLVNLTDGEFTEVSPEDSRSKQSMLWSKDGKWISYYSSGPIRTRLEGTLWEADLTEFMKKMKPGSQKGYTTDFDFKAHLIPAEGVAPDGTFTDSRDGKVYRYKKIGDQIWMAENLAYLPAVNHAIDSSSFQPRYYVYGFDGNGVDSAMGSENFQKYGVLYNWFAANNTACPEGWHLPSDKEWIDLERTLGMDSIDLLKVQIRTSGEVGQKLKDLSFCDDDHIMTGSSGFNALPGGYRQSIPPSYNGIGNFAGFWAFSSQNSKLPAARFIYLSQPAIARSVHSAKTPGYSVRCVRN